eukprot:Sro58_g033870.2  (455) ;mRNA; f:111311-112675
MGTQPKPNPDTLKRRRIRSHVPCFDHTSPRWTKQESKLVLEACANGGDDDSSSSLPKENHANATVVATATAIVDAAVHETIHAAATPGKDHGGEDDDMGAMTRESETEPDIDFGKVAQHVNECRKADSDRPYRLSRTAEECRVHYQRLQCEQQPSLSKAEVALVVQQVEEQQTVANTTGNTTTTQPTIINWQDIAEKIGRDRSPWQCFVAYRKYQTKQLTAVWTPTQDELLLKYLAAQGPQFVLDVAAAEDMSRRLFPDKTSTQIFLRANLSLVNPKLEQGPWSIQEERKLVLCRKIYQKAPHLVPGHFPHRSARGVREKWSRCLDPAYTKRRPFSEEDDKRLRQAVQEALKNGGSISWSELTKKHFPDRRPEILRTRWLQELASDADLLLKIKNEVAARQELELLARSSTGVEDGSSNEPSETDLSDFVLQLVPEKKQPKGSAKRKRPAKKKS